MEWNTKNNEIHKAFRVLKENLLSAPYIPIFLRMVALPISEIIIHFSPERTNRKSETTDQKRCHGGHLCLIFGGRKNFVNNVAASLIPMSRKKTPSLAEVWKPQSSICQWVREHSIFFQRKTINIINIYLWDSVYTNVWFFLFYFLLLPCSFFYAGCHLST